MSLETYISDTLLEQVMPELQCTFTIYKIHSSSTSVGTVRIYIMIDHDIVHEHLDYIPYMDLTYSDAEYQTLLDTDLLIANISMHYLTCQCMTRRLDEYFH